MTVPPPAFASAPVAIVLVNWNNWRDCVENLDSLLGLDHPDFHVYLVDNDSGDRSIEQILAWCAAPTPGREWRDHQGVERWTRRHGPCPIACRLIEGSHEVDAPPPGCRVTLVRSGGNLGFAGGCNVGLRSAASGRYAHFWFLNTDTVVHSRALAELVARAGTDPRIGMVGSTVCYYDRPDVVQAMGGAIWDAATAASRHIGEGIAVADVPADPAAVERQLSYIFGASLLVSSALVRDIGRMREDYFLYYEEIDWAMRSRSRFTLAYAPGSLVLHKSGASSSKSMPLFTAGYFYRNRVRFVSRFFPDRLGAVMRGLIWEAAKLLLKGRWPEARLVGSVLLDARRLAAEALATAGEAARP